MTPFTTLTAVAAPLDIANIDTDAIIPARFLRKHRGDPDYPTLAFHDLRFSADGTENPAFVLNQKPYRAAQVLVAGANFGCGSSREAAVYALMDTGIRSVIAPSFGDIHYANALQNGLLPVVLPDDQCGVLRAELHTAPGSAVTVDLVEQIVVSPTGTRYRFDIDAAHRESLLKGLDDIELVMTHLDQIKAFEAKRQAKLPWLNEENT
ncbi:3-isopropylmalate dehydratase small subunit [Bordetella tumbae]|uniref:3-isopropylmalate dehydratase small subunit n=1 Tax=Bordetella tumbae TaxID=1649139 RepID=UPI0039EE08F1